MATRRTAPTTLLGLAVFVTVAVIGVACTDDRQWANPGETVITPPSGTSVRLAGFSACESDLADLESTRADIAKQMAELADGQADDQLETSASQSAELSGRQEIAAADAVSPQDDGSSQQPASEEQVVGTNTQEVDVDEGDIIKTDGKRIVTLAQGALRVTVVDDDPQVDGVISLSGANSPYGLDSPQMYLHGDQVLVIGSTYEDFSPSTSGPVDGVAPDDVAPNGVAPDGSSDLIEEGRDMMMIGQPLTRISQYDISDPTRPALVRSVDVDGSLVSSRSTSDMTYVIMTNSSPEVLPMIRESAEYSTPAEGDETGASNETAKDGRSFGEPATLGDCSNVLHETVNIDDGVTKPAPERDESGASSPDGAVTSPASPSVSSASLSTVTILSFKDLLTNPEPTVIEGSGDTIYASTGAIYVASPQWDRGLDATAVHRFDISSGKPAKYSASGLVEGQLLNQFSISEFDSVLRLVTTLNGVDTETQLTTLEVDSMTQLGRVSGLAPGESVQSTRFIGAMAYVVTFLQVDPLFAIDVSDPRSPKVLGELKIPGFSEYLHPVGEGLLLGVGRDVDATNGMDLGLKVSLFDVADPRSPKEISQWTLAGGSSPVSYDHHAFTWDPKKRRAFIPVDGLCNTTGGPIISDSPLVEGSDGSVAPSAGSDSVVPEAACSAVAVFDISDESITQTAQIVHDQDPALAGLMMGPQRTVLVGDRVWTLSEGALGVSPSDDPTRVHLIPFA